MKLTDLQSVQKWRELIVQIEAMSPLRASVYNQSGIRIADGHGAANKLCPEIKATDKGQSFICAVAHMNMATIARNTNKPVAEECDAGIIKILVPVIVNHKFIGTVGGCGLLPEEGEVDTFMVSKATDIAEERVAALSKGMGTMSPGQIQKITAFIQSKVDEIISTYGK
jgi:ligand-binding sensor protein